MKLIYNSIFLEHDTGMHPENKKRLDAFLELPETVLPYDEDRLTKVHTPAYIEEMKRRCATENRHEVETFLCPRSFEVACYAAGATRLAAEQGDFALVRPPGHHAFRDRSHGFCLFNNIALAIQPWLEEGKKVMILDIDGHLGDGTSEIFYDNDQVLFWSIHEYPAFPGNGFYNEIGSGKGTGYTINVPLPPGAGDDIFINALASFMPVAEQFAPDLVAISAGFDAHKYDLMLDLRVTSGAFHYIGKMIRERFDRVFATLEGGYNVEELPRCVDNFLAGINGEEMVHVDKPTESGMRIWQTYDMHLHAAIGELSPYWKF
jgi:acetoin utilization deacetylase AcuC-like enzyme